MKPPGAASGQRFIALLRQWRWTGAVTLVLVAACGAVLVPLNSSAPITSGQAQAAVPLRGSPPAPASAFLADPDAFVGGEGPEGRLIAAYLALGQGRGQQAFELASRLVRDHPEFALAQLLYADLLETRAGVPSSFGSGEATPSAQTDERRIALREEALRRLAALRERPPEGKVPAEFAQLPSSTQYAVAVDTSRSRLYLFANGPQGLRLERDFYVSIGKQGIAKQVEGDRRTPLGVYWITAALPQARLDERFGSAALRFNYPNAWDRLRGRTGTGLYLHGVPPSVLTHVPWATDGCVAMSNEDVGRLLDTLGVDTTPVVISRQLTWVAPRDAQQAAAAFQPAYRAWDAARRDGDKTRLEPWYDASVEVPAETTKDRGERDEVSFVAWYGDEAPLMLVTARSKGDDGTAPAPAFRQYWIQRDGKWRILFDGSVSISDNVAVRTQAEPAAKKASKKSRRHGKRAPGKNSA